MTRFPHLLAWRRNGAPCHYSGGLEIDDGALVLTGREPSTGVEASLRIPDYAVRQLRWARSDDESVVGVPGYVLELADAVPLFIRAVGVGRLHEEELGAVLSQALHLPLPQHAAA
jgi:hypothetical protein